MSSNYEVGYAKPPKATQFKSGQSGNPKGRGKGVKNTLTTLMGIAGQNITVTEGGRPVKMSRRTGMLTQLFNKALKGDARATAVILKYLLQAESKAGELEATIRNLSRNARETVDKYLAQARSGQ